MSRQVFTRFIPSCASLASMTNLFPAGSFLLLYIYTYFLLIISLLSITLSLLNHDRGVTYIVIGKFLIYVIRASL